MAQTGLSASAVRSGRPMQCRPVSPSGVGQRGADSPGQARRAGVLARVGGLLPLVLGLARAGLNLEEVLPAAIRLALEGFQSVDPPESSIRSRIEAGGRALLRVGVMA